MKTFQDGDPLFGVMMNAIANLWPNGTAVLSGCTQTGSGAARQVTVAAGTVTINGTVRSVSQQTKTLDAATFDRYDLISVNTSGTVVVTKGTEERRVPALPANSVPIAICLIEAGQTTLPADRIYDSRMDALKLSQIAIDANKNWNGKTITNLGYIESSRIRPEASDEARWTKTGTGGSGQAEITHTVTIPAVYTPGTAKIIANVGYYWMGDEGRDGYVRVRVNGVQVYSNSGNGTHEATISIQGGDLVSITARSLVSMSIALSDTAPVVYPGAPTWPE